MLSRFFPAPKAALRERYRQECTHKNLQSVWYFSALGLLVFTIHLIHHFRLGMAAFGTDMIIYTVLYSYIILHSLFNLVALPKLRDAPALTPIASLLEMAYPVLIALISVMLSIVGVQLGVGPVPFVMGLMTISLILQGLNKMLLVLLASCFGLITLGLLSVQTLVEASPSIAVCATTVILCSVISFLNEKDRVRQFELVEEIKEKNRILDLLSNQDPLTGLFNRRHFEMVIEKEIARSRRFGKALSVLLIDADDFKHVNDNYGHLAGDTVLKEISQILTEEVREIDEVCRYGGEEFLVLLVETSFKQSIDAAERIRSAIERHNFKEIDHKLTVSVGHAQFTNNDRDELIANADKAMYRAKQQGKNRIESAPL